MVPCNHQHVFFLYKPDTIVLTITDRWSRCPSSKLRFSLIDRSHVAVWLLEPVRIKMISDDATLQNKENIGRFQRNLSYSYISLNYSTQNYQEVLIVIVIRVNSRNQWEYSNFNSGDENISKGKKMIRTQKRRKSQEKKERKEEIENVSIHHHAPKMPLYDDRCDWTYQKKNINTHTKKNTHTIKNIINRVYKH